MNRRRKGSRSLVPLLGLALGLGACLWSGGPPSQQCSIEIVGLSEFRSGASFFDAAYRVQGQAGSAAKVWLAARAGSGEYLSGNGVSVGPGQFEARVQLDLTSRPLEYVAVLDVAGRRCRASATPPGG